MNTQLEIFAKQLLELGYEGIRMDTTHGARLITAEFIVRLYDSGYYVINSIEPIATPVQFMEQESDLLFCIKNIQHAGKAIFTAEIGPFPMYQSLPSRQVLKQQIAYLRKVEHHLQNRKAKIKSELLSTLITTSPPELFVEPDCFEDLVRAFEEIELMKYKILWVNGKRGIGKETCVRQLIYQRNMVGIRVNENRSAQAIAEEINAILDKVQITDMEVVLILSEVLGGPLQESFLMYAFENLFRSIQEFSRWFPVIILGNNIKIQFSYCRTLVLKEPDAISSGLILKKNGKLYYEAPEDSQIGNPLYSIIINETKRKIL